jgi:hypothetical protein
VFSLGILLFVNQTINKQTNKQTKDFETRPPSLLGFITESPAYRSCGFIGNKVVSVSATSSF